MKKMTKTQMKKIVGGTSCTADCGNGTSISCSGDSCASRDYNYQGPLKGTCSSSDSSGNNLQYKTCEIPLPY